MKTLSFRNFRAGRSGRVLVTVDSAVDGVVLPSGLNLIVAPNGHGKTTLLQSMAGVLKPMGGLLELGGDFLDTREKVLQVPEYLAFPKMIYPEEWMEFVAGDLPPREDWKRWVTAFRLEPLMKRYLGRMSQGERRKVTWLAAHVAPQPVVLMDEPLDGLDVLALDSAVAMLRDWEERGRVVAVVAHQTAELAEHARSVHFIREGRLASLESVDGLGSRATADRIRQAVRKLYLPSAP
ncbi:MAG: ATP-binding cassette domain-containing protein [Bdellovibrionales bacterium]|nr:ATP-binding cassette domain-containing protein [Bdellovibrionales bacterium]